MKQLESAFSVHVDVTNPGQFLACCGLLELADRLWRGAEGWFEKNRFHIRSPAENVNVQKILACLAEARSVELSGSIDPKVPPVGLGPPFDLRLDWWLDSDGKKSILGKMFSGQKRTLLDVRRLQRALKGILAENDGYHNLFDPPWSAPLPGRFGVDPRAAWEALDVGFSPNDQQMAVTTFVVVELLGAIGLQVSPPRRIDDTPADSSAESGKIGLQVSPPRRIDTSYYMYTTWSVPLCACVSRVGAVGIIPGIGCDAYQFALTRRGSYKGFSFANPTGDESWLTK